MLYRINHQLVAIPASSPYIIYSSTTNRGQLQQHHCRINSYQNSFFPSLVNRWNKLPSDTAGAASLNLYPQQTRLHHAALNHYWTMFYQHLTMHRVYQFLLMYSIFTRILSLAHLFYAYFSHGPNTSASAQYDNTRGAWLTYDV